MTVIEVSHDSHGGFKLQLRRKSKMTVKERLIWTVPAVVGRTVMGVSRFKGPLQRGVKGQRCT